KSSKPSISRSGTRATRTRTPSMTMLTCAYSGSTPSALLLIPVISLTTRRAATPNTTTSRRVELSSAYGAKRGFTYLCSVHHKPLLHYRRSVDRAPDHPRTMRSPVRALAHTSQCGNHTGSDNAAGETPVVALRGAR